MQSHNSAHPASPDEWQTVLADIDRAVGASTASSHECFQRTALLWRVGTGSHRDALHSFIDLSLCHARDNSSRCQLPDADSNRLQPIAAWSAVRRTLGEAMRDLEELDDAIRTAAAAGISEMGIVIESAARIPTSRPVQPARRIDALGGKKSRERVRGIHREQGVSRR